MGRQRFPGPDPPPTVAPTGTSSGFGKRLVRAVLARGDYAIATVRSQGEFPLELDDAARARLHIVELDVTEPEASIRAKVDDAVRVWGRIDVLVNNAGNAPKSLLEEGGYAAAFQMKLGSADGGQVDGGTDAVQRQLLWTDQRNTCSPALHARAAVGVGDILREQVCVEARRGGACASFTFMYQSSTAGAPPDDRLLHRLKSSHPRQVPPPVLL